MDYQPLQASPPIEQREVRQPSANQTRQELKDAIRGTNEVLVSASTKLSLFPDSIAVDREKLTITKRNFVSSAEVMSIRIEDILNISAKVGPLLGAIEVSSRIPTVRPYLIGKFWRDDALRVMHVAQGYVIALQHGIDCNSLSLKELRSMLNKLGQEEHPHT